MDFAHTDGQYGYVAFYPSFILAQLRNRLIITFYRFTPLHASAPLWL